MARASSAYGVPLGVLYSVGLTESGARGSLQQFALNVGGEARYPSTRLEAIRQVHEAERSGIGLVDVGCMQINLRYHRARFASLEAMFDASKNVAYGARYLKELNRREGNWTQAVARYHAGAGNDVAQRKYVCSVIRRMVTEGLGGWTPSARQLCGGENNIK